LPLPGTVPALSLSLSLSLSLNTHLHLFLTQIGNFTNGKTPTQCGRAILRTHLYFPDRYFSFSLPEAGLSPANPVTIALLEPAVPTGEFALFSGEFILFTGESVLFSGENIPFTGEFTLFSGENTPFTGEIISFTAEFTPFTGEIIVPSRVRFVAA
jgi:hypothetical protein